MKSHSNSGDQAVQTEEQTSNRTKGIALSEMSKEIVMRHLNSFIDNNLETLLSDYTNESVLITRSATYSGVEEIRTFFVDLNKHFPKQTSNLELDKVVAHADLVFIVWHAKTPSLEVPMGSDTFIIREGKIYQQTFIGQLNFINQ